MFSSAPHQRSGLIKKKSQTASQFLLLFAFFIYFFINTDHSADRVDVVDIEDLRAPGSVDIDQDPGAARGPQPLVGRRTVGRYPPPHLPVGRTEIVHNLQTETAADEAETVETEAEAETAAVGAAAVAAANPLLAAAAAAASCPEPPFDHPPAAEGSSLHRR